MSGRLIAFDLDGTLVDSRAAVVGCFQHALQANGLGPVPDEAIARNIGLPLARMLEGVVPADRAEACIAVYRRDFADWDRRLSRAFPGVLELVRELRDGGARLVIASSKSLVGVRRVVTEHGVEELFDGLLGGDSVTRGKPHPQMLQRAMALVGAQPEQTTMVGDTTYDVEMGVAAGVRAIGVGWGMHPSGELLDAGAQAVAATCAELAALLGR